MSLKSALLKVFRVNKFLAKLKLYSAIGIAAHASAIPAFVATDCLLIVSVKFSLFLMASTLFGINSTTLSLTFFSCTALKILFLNKCSPKSGGAK